MRHIFFVGILAITAILGSCKSSDESKKSSSVKLNGLHKYYYPDGNLYLEINYKDSIPHGISKQYFKNGKVFEEAAYVNGVMYGITRRYHETGALSLETPYDSGRIHGIQRKFRKDGTLAFEAPYYYDKPCVGLKEYYLSGKPIVKYPNIVIKTEDKLLKENQYTLRLSLTEDIRKVEFYKGELTDGKYIGKKAEKLYTDTNGIGRIDYYLGPGQFAMERLNVIAKIKTDLGNYYITQLSYNLAIENKF